MLRFGSESCAYQLERLRHPRRVIGRPEALSRPCPIPVTAHALSGQLRICRFPPSVSAGVSIVLHTAVIRFAGDMIRTDRPGAS